MACQEIHQAGGYFAGGAVDSEKFTTFWDSFQLAEPQGPVRLPPLVCFHPGSLPVLRHSALLLVAQVKKGEHLAFLVSPV